MPQWDSNPQPPIYVDWPICGSHQSRYALLPTHYPLGHHDQTCMDTHTDERKDNRYTGNSWWYVYAPKASPMGGGIINPTYCLMMGLHPSLADSHTSLHGGIMASWPGEHLGTYNAHRSCTKSGEHWISTSGQNWWTSRPASSWQHSHN